MARFVSSSVIIVIANINVHIDFYNKNGMRAFFLSFRLSFRSLWFFLFLVVARGCVSLPLADVAFEGDWRPEREGQPRHDERRDEDSVIDADVFNV